MFRNCGSFPAPRDPKANAPATLAWRAGGFSATRTNILPAGSSPRGLIVRLSISPLSPLSMAAFGSRVVGKRILPLQIIRHRRIAYPLPPHPFRELLVGKMPVRLSARGRVQEERCASCEINSPRGTCIPVPGLPNPSSTPCASRLERVQEGSAHRASKRSGALGWQHISPGATTTME
jgi:hypothetical protein